MHKYVPHGAGLYIYSMQFKEMSKVLVGNLRQSTHEGLPNPQYCIMLFTLMILVMDTDDYMAWDPHLIITKYEELEVDSVCYL